MRLRIMHKYFAVVSLAVVLVATAATLLANSEPQSAPNIGVNGYFASDKAQKGRTVQAAVIMDIPHGYHVNSNRPLEKFLVATQLTLEAPGVVRVGTVSYPRPLLRTFSSKDKLSVYEGQAILRFNLTVPASFGSGSLELRAKLRYQSCNDSLCFPPQSREPKLEDSSCGRDRTSKED